MTPHSKRLSQLIKYLKGKLSHEEQHDLEQNMHTDPFLSDAVDGFAHVSADELEDDLLALSQKLSARTQENKNKRLLVYLSAAASIVVFVGIGLLYFVAPDKQQVAANLPAKQKKQQATHKALPLKKNSTERSQPDEPKSKAKNASASEIKPTEIIEKEIIEKPEAKAQPKKRHAVAYKKQDADSDTKQTTAIEKPLVSRQKNKNSETLQVHAASKRARLADVSEDISAEVLVNEQQTEADKKQEVENYVPAPNSSKVAPHKELPDSALPTQMNNRKISGTIKSLADYAPLPGAVVRVKGKQTGTFADFDGQYSLNALPGDTLVYSFIGFEDKEELVVENSDEMHNEILLNAQADLLDEVVVIGYGTRKKSKRMAPKNKCKPKGGYWRFRQYIKKNKQIDHKRKLQIDTQLRMDTAGKVVHVRFISACSAAVQAEIKRLLEAGPLWKCSGDSTEQNTVFVTISL